MKKEQYKKYKSLEEEIQGVRDFCEFCGIKHHNKLLEYYPFKLVLSKPKLLLRKICHWSTVTENTYAIPWDLQLRIISVVEQYLDEKEKELEEI